MSFCTSLLFQLWLQIRLCYPHLLCCPLLTLPSINTGLILAVTEDINTATGTPTTIGIIANTGLIFMVFFLLPLQTGNRVTSSRPNGLLVLGSGLLTSLLSWLSSINFASLSATSPPNVLSFAVGATNLLLILLLVQFLQVVGSRILVRTNMLLLILQLWPILLPILVMITCILVVVRVFSYPLLGILCYVPLNTY